MKFIAEYSLKENLRKKCTFAICLLTCFFVSLICLVAKTIISQGSLIFLMLGEKESGEIDFYISPSTKVRTAYPEKPEDYYIDYAFINFTLYSELMSKNDEEFSKMQNPLKTSTPRIYLNGVTTIGQIYLMLIDTNKEKEMELGRSYPYKKLNEGECLIHKNMYVPGTEQVTLGVSMRNLIINSLLYFYDEQKEKPDPNLKNLENLNTYIKFPCKIVGVMDDTYGKESSDDDNFFIMELEYFFNYISKYINKDILNLFPDYPNYIQQMKPEEYSNILIINFPKNRLNYYTGDDYYDLLDKGVKYMNSIVKKLGNLRDFKLTMPLITKMTQFKYGTTILNLILNIILLSIFGLSLILIHSLILITTETNSFEFGVLRLVGNSKKNIILIIIFECICFSMPAFILAFISSFGVLKIVNTIIKNELCTDLELSITIEGFLMAFFLNFLAPVIASIFPIKNILKKNIATSINTMINKTQGVKIEIFSLTQKEFRSVVVFGIITFLYGASIYYFLPLSLISINLSMLGGIFLWILFGILMGFVLLSINVENILQKILTYTILFFTRSYTKLLILKNLTAHRIKNRKTSIMFSLSVGIFIMISVGFDLILQTVKNMNILKRGSEIQVGYPSQADNYFTPGDVYPALMELYDKKLIEKFSFKSCNIGDLYDSFFYILNYGKNIKSRLSFIGLSPEYFASTNKQDLVISEQNKSYSDYTPSEQLYFSEFRGKVGVSGILKYEFNINLNSDIFLKFTDGINEMLFLSKASIILDSASGLNLNKYPSIMIIRDALIPIPMYLDVYQKYFNYFGKSFDDLYQISYEDFPINIMNIKPKNDITEKDISEITNILRQKGPRGSKMWLFANMKSRIDMIQNIVYLIFYIVSSVVLLFCLFNLTASMTINIYDQKKEIAIFRSLGTKKNHVIFIYIAEAIILILASSIIGSIIGSIISYTMVLQWAIFTNINVAFVLPIGSIIIVIFISIFGGIVSTFIPAKNMLNNSIAQLIKSN